MVKGIQRQVILVRSPDPELFEQAIFILKDSAVREGVTEEMLLRQAKQAVSGRKGPGWLRGLFWAGLGAVTTACIWGVTLLV